MSCHGALFVQKGSFKFYALNLIAKPNSWQYEISIRNPHGAS